MSRVAWLLLLPLLAGCDRVEEPLQNATRFVARMSCSCVFVTGRELQACIRDLPEQAAWLDVDVDRAGKRVLANALWVDGVAAWTEEGGCRLQD